MLLNSAVTECDASGVALGDTRIDSRTVVWAAGVRASAAGKWLNARTDRAGRVMVGPDLKVPGHQNIFVIGDTAHVAGEDGRALPGVATVAKQQAQYVAWALMQKSLGLGVTPFRYKDPGSMATIGRKRAVAEIGNLKLSGFFAWLLWSLAHIYFLIGFRSRLSVALSWAWSYLTFERGSRLITGPDEVVEVVAPSQVTMEEVEPLRGAA